MCMWNGKQVTEKEWWTLRLQKVIEGGCDIKVSCALLKCHGR